MLLIHISDKEIWNEQLEEFFIIKGCDLTLEHSLVAISKWESKYHKSFIDTENKTSEEMLDYIKMMVVGKQPEDDKVFMLLSREQISEIAKYINDPMTATTISKDDEDKVNDKKKSGKFTTSEEIYSWMCLQNIPFECQYWHLNRLIMLIKLCAIANAPKDKKKKRMTSSDLALRRAKMEAARKRFGG